MSSRPTKEATTPSGVTFTYYEYMNGGDQREYQKLFTAKMNAADLNNLTDEKKATEVMSRIEAEVVFESQELLVKQLVTRVGDRNVTGKDALDAVLELRPSDTQFIIDTLDKLSNENAKKPDGQSQSTPLAE